MKKVFFSSFCTLLMFITANHFASKVHAESLNNKNPSPARVTQQKIKIQTAISQLNEQLNQVNKEMESTEGKIAQRSLDIIKATDGLNQLSKDLEVINDTRSEVSNKSPIPKKTLETILKGFSISDFLFRQSLDAASNQTDPQLTVNKLEIEAKNTEFEEKQVVLSCLQLELQGLSTHLKDQQKYYRTLKDQLDRNNIALFNITESDKPDITILNIRESEKQEKYISNIINAAKKYIGRSNYVFGGGRNNHDVINGRFDCSAFVHWAFAQAGIEIGSTTDEIKSAGKRVSVSNMKPGDLVFFDTYKMDGHVGIYLGDGKFIGSQNSTGVAIADMSKGYWKNAFKGVVVRY